MKKHRIIDQIMPSAHVTELTQCLRLHLPSEFADSDIHIFASCPSTNDYLKQTLMDGEQNIRICISEQQTAGRGQHGRQWLSPKGNVYLSVFLPCAVPIVGYLSLIVSYCLCQMPVFVQLMQQLSVITLETNQQVKFGIKWANDIGILQQRTPQFNKLAGVLIEPVHQGNQQGVIIGVGINLATAPDISGLSVENQLGYGTTCLADWQITTPMREIYVQAVHAILEAMQMYDETNQQRLPRYFAKAYSQLDVLHGRQVKIQQGHKTLMGRACGIDDQGGLKLVITNGGVQGVQIAYNGNVNVNPFID